MGRWERGFLAGALVISGTGLLPAVGALPPEDPVVQFVHEPYEKLLGPENETRQVSVTLQFSCSLPEARSLAPIRTIFRLGRHAPPLSAVVSPASVEENRVPPEQCTDNAIRHNATTQVSLVVSRNATAFEPILVEVLANISIQTADGEEEAYGPFSLNLTIEPDFLAISQLIPEAYVQKVRDRESARFNFTIENFSNGGAVATLEVQAKENLTIDLPSTVTLGNRLVDPAAARRGVTLVVTPPPAKQLEDRFVNVELVSRLRSADPRGTSTEEQRLTFSVQVESKVGSPGPGFDAIVVLAGLLGAWAAWRRRRGT